MYRPTVTLGDLAGGEEHAKLMHRVREDSYSVDPVPPALAEIVAARSALRHRGAGGVAEYGGAERRRHIVVATQLAQQPRSGYEPPRNVADANAAAVSVGGAGRPKVGGGDDDDDDDDDVLMSGGNGASASVTSAWAARAAVDASYRGEAPSPRAVRNPLTGPLLSEPQREARHELSPVGVGNDAARRTGGDGTSPRA